MDYTLKNDTVFYINYVSVKLNKKSQSTKQEQRHYDKMHNFFLKSQTVYNQLL